VKCVRKDIFRYFRGTIGAAAAWILAAAAAVGGAGLTVYGADSSVIENVSITFQTTYGEPEEIPEPEITVSTAGCSIVDYQYRTEYDKWKPGRKVRVEITLEAEEGKVFPTSLTKSKCKITGADFVSAKALDGDKFQVRVDYKPITVLGSPTQAGWSSSNRTRAVWKSVDFAPGYSLVLYGDSKVVKRLTVEQATADLSEFMRDEDKTYYYEVKAIPMTTDEKKYLKEGEAVSSTEQEYDWEDLGSRTSDGGDIKGNNYIMPDGTMAVNTWKKIFDNWYYFDQNGNMARGWTAIGGFWYYLDSNGVMKNGWVNPSGDSWYYLSEGGAMLTGWVQPSPNSWYYMDGSGVMRRGWADVAGKRYYLGTDGKMRTGWNQIDGAWYYFYSDGSMAVNTAIEGWTILDDGKAPGRS
jgi:glucan-binding YG repeat protein